MGRMIRRIAIPMSLFLAFACSEKASVGESDSNLESSEYKLIRIIFDLPGDDIGGPEHERILVAIKAAIHSGEAGEIASSGFGMGNMEIVMAVENEESVIRLKRIIADSYPDAKYRIEHREE